MTTESKNLSERLGDAYNECVNIGDGSSAVAIRDSMTRLETMAGNLNRAHMSTVKKLSEIGALRGWCSDLEAEVKRLTDDAEQLERSRDGWEADTKREMQNVGDRDVRIAQLERLVMGMVWAGEFSDTTIGEIKRLGLDAKTRIAELEESILKEKLKTAQQVKLNMELEAKLRAARERNTVYGPGLKAVDNLMSESAGVCGLHLNGDDAPWDTLRTGGHYEDWLLDFDKALAAIPEPGTKISNVTVHKPYENAVHVNKTRGMMVVIPGFGKVWATGPNPHDPWIDRPPEPEE